MKRLLIILMCSIMSIGYAQAQKMDFWLDAGLKAQYGFTALYNANATTENALGEKWDFTLASGVKYGLKLGINWNYTGVSFDVMRGTMKGKYQYVDSSVSTDRTDEISIDVTDIYVLFRNAKHKGYIELGPKISFIGDVRDNLVTEANPTGTPNLNDKYESTNLAAVLGFGTYILGPPDGRFSGILGFRFEYGFQDIVNDEGKISSDEFSRVPVNYGGEAGSTNPIFVGIVFEANWGIGGVGQARCGERSKFIWF